MQNLTDAQQFILFIAEGVAIGVLFDLFRGFRISFPSNDFMTGFQDSIFLIVSLSLVIRNNFYYM